MKTTNILAVIIFAKLYKVNIALTHSLGKKKKKKRKKKK